MINKKPKTKSLFQSENTLLVTTRVKVLLALLVGLVLSLLVVYVAREQYLGSLISQTETLATLVDKERVSSLVEDDQNAEGNERVLKSQLQEARSVNGSAHFLYLMATSPTGDVYFLVDSENPGSESYSPRGQVYPEATEALKASFYTGKSFIEGPVTDRWGTWLSVISPVYNTAGQQVAIIGMDLTPATYYSVLTTAAVIPLIGALLVSIVFIATDTIRRRRQEAVRMRSELVSIASHELRTPLTGIRWGEEALLAGKLAKGDRETLQTMYDSTLRLQESIEDILQLANWQAGRNQELVRTSINIGQLIDGIYATQKLPAAQKNITLTFGQDWPEELLINCDGQRMKRVLNNLISNAIKYSKPSTSVVVDYQRVDGQHLISIKDHGIGIPKREQEKVFAGFYRASNAIQHDASGTGMGLYMSRSTVEQHGGKLWLISETGKGTTAFIRLP
ncbi:TPA: hypothetical protein DCF80_00030 [Candidatus Saccharibacteria bacterium]|nr:hypothetical protein [Candidatus Saccharibacteria bacterium]HRK41024.1 ATP-binding protein [Candidatus Saccharibacteria bacterium]